MKIAITATGTTPESPLDARFGRAAYFLVFDPETNTWETVENTQNLNAAQGAGIQAAQTIVKAGAGALVTGHCGPKAFRVLAAAGIKVYNTDASTITEALTRYRAGQLTEATAANVESHWA